jgi:serine/threonine protein kinase
MLGARINLLLARALLQNYSGRRVDIWSMGVILFNLGTGRMPFGVDAVLHLLYFPDFLFFLVPLSVYRVSIRKALCLWRRWPATVHSPLQSIGLI